MSMHPQTEHFIRAAVRAHLDRSGWGHSKRKPWTVVEIGSKLLHAHDPHDPRPVVDALLHGRVGSYTGLDANPGPGVDVESVAHSWTPPGGPGSVDLVLCLMSLEHDPYWRETVSTALRWLSRRGLLIVVCAGEGMFPHEHNESPIPGHYGNVSSQDVAELVDGWSVLRMDADASPTEVSPAFHYHADDVGSHTDRAMDDGKSRRYDWTRTRVAIWRA